MSRFAFVSRLSKAVVASALLLSHCRLPPGNRSIPSVSHRPNPVAVLI